MTDKPYDSLKDTVDHINNVRQKLYRLVNDFLDRALMHDMSKTISPEKDGYDKYSQSLRTLEYGSQEYKDTLLEMKPFIDHHYSLNSHHPEYYRDGINGMNLLDLLEMVCDWKAAGERHIEKPTSIVQSIEINAKRFEIDEQLKQILLNTVCYLDWV